MIDSRSGVDHAPDLQLSLPQATEDTQTSLREAERDAHSIKQIVLRKDTHNLKSLLPRREYGCLAPAEYERFHILLSQNEIHSGYLPMAMPIGPCFNSSILSYIFPHALKQVTISAASIPNQVYNALNCSFNVLLLLGSFVMVVINSLGHLLNAMSTCTGNLELSCTNNDPSDTCCVNSPGGLMIQAQIWGTMKDSWSIHGLWPNLCNGKYQSSCAGRTQYKSVEQYIAKDDGLLSFMKEYWPSNQSPDDDFWTHVPIEFNKHGTCVSTLDNKCFRNYEEGIEIIPYFNQTVSLFQMYNTWHILHAARIVPSSTKTYRFNAIIKALEEATGQAPALQCKNDELEEVWYYFYVVGPAAGGEYQITKARNAGNCPPDVKYLPHRSPKGNSRLKQPRVFKFSLDYTRPNKMDDQEYYEYLAEQMDRKFY
ncbi:Ribonuclease T2 [Neolecta irregularis DAH-3]|uniref:Ribonuclease T2 n=1 Tax=Neolecta irregularis (strain DAH-3) TaxID=1198029 RepID=A0A1U7LU08_NEOID|nr:Ribonuclease T2 [Neolecta irregularis DAH-3]|eukprot:OLL26147.1 Ribonuclease T2 [Neolecta irregularis DAH-3]